MLFAIMKSRLALRDREFQDFRPLLLYYYNVQLVHCARKLIARLPVSQSLNII